jgi:Ni/Fe-hydrogenase subunit HybB-like protein
MMFWCEVGIGVIAPMLLFFSSAVRRSRVGLFVAGLLTVCGFMFNRLNVAVTSFERHNGGTYFPSFIEISVSLMIVALGFAAFRLAAKYLPIFTDEHEHHQHHAHPTHADTDVVSFVDVSDRSGH